MRAHVPLLLTAAVVTAAAGCGGGGTTATGGRVETDAGPPPPLMRLPAARGGAANIPLADAGARVMTRWVARRTGLLRTLYLQVKVEGSDCEPGGRPGYANGTSGRLLATTQRVSDRGRPDPSGVLRTHVLVPCRDGAAGSLGVPLDLRVKAGQEYATVVSNVDRRPGDNSFSTNHLYVDARAAGANGRDGRRPGAAGAAYGLDAREALGYSADGGRTWRVPGGPYGISSGMVFLPTYVQRYAGGATAGQPYYWSVPASGTVTVAYPPARRRWVVRALAAHVESPGRSRAVLSVDGAARASATLSGQGLVRARLGPVTVAAGAVLSVTVRAGSPGLALHTLHADAPWARLMRSGDFGPVLADGEGEGVTVPVYALPPPPAR